MNNKNYYLIALAILALTQSCAAYNGRDLRFHTECLSTAVLTGEDLDVPFVRRHLSIGCDQQDIVDTQGEDVEAITTSFLTNPVVGDFNAEDCVARFRELSGILNEIFRAPTNDAEKAACILIAKAVSRDLFGTLFNSIKDAANRTRLEGERKAFYEGLAPKRLAAAVAASEDEHARGAPKAPVPPVLPAKIIAQIHAALPYIASLSAQQLGEMVLYFKSLSVE